MSVEGKSLSSGTPSFRITSSILYLPERVINSTNALSLPKDCRIPPHHKSSFYLLTHHRARLLAAARDFKWTEAAALLAPQDGLRNLNKALQSYIMSRGSYPMNASEPQRLRINISHTGAIEIQADAEPVPPPLRTLFPSSLSAVADSPAPPPGGGEPRYWRVYLDTKGTSPSLFTTHKTTSRDHYSEARHRCNISVTNYLVTDEVLLSNPHGEIMEGSICTVYFHRPQLEAHYVDSDDEDEEEEEGGPEWVTPELKCGGNSGTTRMYALQNDFCREGVVRLEDVRVGEKVVLSNGFKGFVGGVICELEDGN